MTNEQLLDAASHNECAYCGYPLVWSEANEDGIEYGGCIYNFRPVYWRHYATPEQVHLDD